MWANIRRLGLGIALILLAAAVLLVSDWNRRRPAQQLQLHLAVLQHSSQPILDEGVRGIIDGLAESGFREGPTVSIRRYNAENDLPTANTIAKEIVGSDADLVLTVSTLSLQAMANANRAGKKTQVFSLVTDPAAAGVGISASNPLEHPPYLVGYGTMQPVAEAFRLAQRLFPQLQTVGVVWNPAEVNSEAQLKVARATCETLGIRLIEAAADSTSGVMEAASSLVARGVQAIWLPGDVTVLTAADTLIATARKAGIPVFTSIPGNTKLGALFDLGANYHEVGRLAGVLAGQILDGRDPATVPIENVMPQTLLINTAALSGLKDAWRVPDDILRSAQAQGTPTAVGQATGVAADRVYQIGIVYFAPDPGADICMQGLFDGLRDLGFIEGKNLDVQRAHAQGEIANIPALLQNFDSLDLDAIVPLTTPCLTAACGIVKHTPVVFTYVYDPIAAGAGISFTDHNPNVTGVGSFPPVGETVEMIRRLVPGVQSVGTIYNSSEANSRKVVEVARAAFAKAGLQLEEVSVTNASEVFQAAQALVGRGVQAFWITGDNTAIQAFDAIVKVADDADIPIINNDPELVGRGALACVGIGFYQSGYAAAKLLAAVLHGASPATLPIENVAVKTVSVNLKAAQTLGMTIPPDVLQKADVIIDAAGVQSKPAATPTTAPALGKTWRLNILEYVNVPDSEDAERGMRAGLRDAGLVEGRDYTVQLRNAQGDMATLSTLVDAALTAGADLLMTLSTPTLQAALQRAHGVPIVFTFVADAVIAGAGRSNDDHLPNVTGVPTMSAYKELLDVVRECLPSARRIGTLFVPAEVNSVFNKDQLTATARQRGTEVVAVAANTSTEMSDAAQALCSEPIDAVVQVASNLTTVAFASITQAARRARLPLFGSLSSNARDGAAVVVARDYYDGGHEAGLMAARIMRGTPPAAIPFTPLKKTRIIVNLEAAKAVNLRIPYALLQRAAEVIGKPG
jgi:putative tryptophan/tyrosine transport system substrate-binding protein